MNSGYFSDPYPLDTSSTSSVAFSGTFKEIITCKGGVTSGCFSPAPISVAFDAALAARVKEHGLDVRSTKAHHITRMSDGHWEMVLSSEVVPHGRPRSDHWNLIMHAHPAQQTGTDTAPEHWVADSVLVGSLDHSEPANYDGKYFEDGGRLYLLYSKSISTDPTRFGIGAQRLDTPSRPADSEPVMLLDPSPSGAAGLASENYFGVGQKNGFRLVETGNVFKIDGKYVMVYSVGSYQRPTYKIGVAYSDTFLPGDGGTYRKIHRTDAKGVWGRPGADEVDYLLQAQKPSWPHYVRDQVQAPGVGSLIENDHTWYLFFAGYDPSEKPQGDDQTFAASHRAPYFLPVHVRISDDTSVAQASDRELASWIAP
ncbi:hypothetical protein [Streptomyces sp. TS71-3]|uniref:hypothetical protein n=1 Tax=Streptomyces sp. TS71-3 TaxID=2733862 RepID=UPI001B29AB14|nr:hypothetical protein [Streptomyces sp. TS71-3]GHJ41538.1 hypothetical protein Sm713_71470 [Streptomyces sp. TS71-3]